jgi:hypothetical protein
VFDNQVMTPARHSTVAIAVAGRPAIAGRGRALEFLTILVAAVEALAGAAAAFFSGSVALLSFSLDSVVEAASGAAVLWCLSADFDDRRRRHSERIALQIVGACFLLLAVYVAYESIAHLLMREVPGRSISGIVLAAISMITMPLLARAKRRVARDIGSGAMHADATQRQVLCIPLCDPSRWFGSERSLGLVVGGPVGQFGHGAHHCQRRDAKPSRKELL